jgi:CHRD domain/PEP-CTERM motif
MAIQAVSNEPQEIFMKRLLIVWAMAAAMVFAAPFSHATIINYSANLSGANESSPNASTGTGSAFVTVDDVANTMHVQVTFSDLLGPTAAAHIHCCTAAPLTGTAGVVTTTPTFAGFPLGVTSGTYDNILDMTLASSYNPSFVTAQGGTTAGAEAFLFNGMSLDESYFNIHTSQFPGGEIRGFLTQVTGQVPEPATLALFCFGLAGLGWSRYKKV